MMLTRACIVRIGDSRACSRKSPHSRSHRPPYGWCYLFTVSSSDLHFFHAGRRNWFSRFQFHLQPKARKGALSSCETELRSMPLTYELDLDRDKTNYRVKYLRQRSFLSTVIIRTHTHTHTHPTALHKHKVVDKY